MPSTDDAIVEYLDPKKHARSVVASLGLASVVVVVAMVAVLCIFLPGIGCKMFNWTVNGCPSPTPSTAVAPPAGTALRIAGCKLKADGTSDVVCVAVPGQTACSSATVTSFLFAPTTAGAVTHDTLYTMQTTSAAAHAGSDDPAQYVVVGAHTEDPKSDLLTLAADSSSGAWLLRGTLAHCFLYFVTVGGTMRGALVLRPPTKTGGALTVACDASAVYSADAWQLLSPASAPQCGTSA